MGGGASSSKKKKWARSMHLTVNEAEEGAQKFSTVFPIWAMAMTANQKQLALATGDHRIHLFCLVTSVKLISLVGHSDTIWCLGYSPNDEFLASGSADGTVRLWQVASGFMIMILPRTHANWIWTLSWSPDSKCLVTGGSDTRICVWAAAKAAEVSEQTKMITRELAMQTQQRILEGDSTGRACDPMWREEMAEMQLIAAEETARQTEMSRSASMPKTWWAAHEKSVLGVTFFPQDSSMIASVGAEGTLAIWDAESGTLDCRLQGHLGPTTCVSVSPPVDNNGNVIVATGGEDHTVRLWDLRDVKAGSKEQTYSKENTMGFNVEHFTLKGHEHHVTCVKFTRDGRLLASCSKDCKVLVWNPTMDGPTLHHKWLAHEARITTLAWNHDQCALWSSSTDGLAFSWAVPKQYHNIDDDDE